MPDQLENLKRIAELVREIEQELLEARINARRYQLLRCCTVAKFREITHANIVKGRRFDEMVDALGRGNHRMTPADQFNPFDLVIQLVREVAAPTFRRRR